MLGDHTLLAYSNLGLTREQYSSLLVAQSFMSLQILLMSPRVLLAFAAVTSMCFDQERLLVHDNLCCVANLLSNLYTHLIWMTLRLPRPPPPHSRLLYQNRHLLWIILKALDKKDIVLSIVVNTITICLCDVTLSVYPHRAGLENMPGHGGIRTYDLWNTSPMLCQLSYAVRSVRVCDISKLSLVPSISV